MRKTLLLSIKKRCRELYFVGESIHGILLTKSLSGLIQGHGFSETQLWNMPISCNIISKLIRHTLEKYTK